MVTSTPSTSGSSSARPTDHRTATLLLAWLGQPASPAARHRSKASHQAFRRARGSLGRPAADDGAVRRARRIVSMSSFSMSARRLAARRKAMSTGSPRSSSLGSLSSNSSARASARRSGHRWNGASLDLRNSGRTGPAWTMANGHVKSPNSALTTTSAPRTSGGPVIPCSDASGASTDRTVPTELLPADRVEHPAELPLVGQPDERGVYRPLSAG